MRMQERGSGALCRAVLDQLPAWFGIGEANDDYVDMAERTPTAVASLDGRDVGLLTVVRHSEHAAEVHLMAVVPELHRRGIGAAMLRFVEDRLGADGVEYLQVKTLSPAREDEGYDRTRRFYEAQGFRWLEEFPTLWDPSNPALQMIKALPPAFRR